MIFISCLLNFRILYIYIYIYIYIFFCFQANSETACERACTFETEFLCRSYLYLGAPTGSDYNCKLYHLDHWTIPAGISAFLNSQTPLVGDGSRIGKYYENRCERKLQFFCMLLFYHEHQCVTLFILGLQVAFLLVFYRQSQS